MNQQDLQHIRSQFPLLSEQVYGKPLIYLDNAATTQKPQQVLDALQRAYTTLNANIHRGVHYLSQQATAAHEAARQTVADFIGAANKSEVIFTRGTTESINLVAFSLGERYVHEGDEVVVSALEHHSNLVPWQMLCERKKARLRIIPLLPSGDIDMEQYEQLLCERTRIVSVAHISNVYGAVNDIQTVIQKAHERNIPVLIDGAQAAPHIAINVQQLDADFYAFSGHKMYGPTGIGVLYGKSEYLDQMPPYQGGGEMIQRVTYQHTTYNELPYKFEAGTPDFIGSVGLAAAIDYLQALGMQAIAEHEQALTDYALQRLQEIPAMRLIGEPAQRCGVISFLVGNIHPYDLGMLLDKQGVAVRTGHHCAEPLIDWLQVPGTVRMSFGLYNTREEIDRFMPLLQRAVDMLQ